MLEARRIALTSLVRVDVDEAFANLALDAALASAGRVDPRDVALATELTYGTLRRQVSVDHALSHFSRTPLAQLDAQTRALLRLGAYQILHTRVPPRAAVHTAAELSKEIRQGRAVKYVNAVLRSLLRERESILIPPESVDPVGFLSITESFPRWLVERVVTERGRDARAFLAAFNEPAPLTLRANLRRGPREEAQRALAEAQVEAQPTRHSPAGLLAPGARTSSELLRPAHGRWQAQDEAAQLVGYYCAPQPGWRVLDACAAPGGKTCHLAELMDDRGLVDAVDIHARKLAGIAEGARRLGLASVRTHAADAAKPLPFTRESAPEGYDLVLVDAPCSGLGTLRRHPELKTRRLAEDLHRLAALQAAILRNVAPLVRPGGLLVYAVCTFTREEGPDQMERFLATTPGFRRERPPSAPRPGTGVVDWTPLLDPRGDLVVAPHSHGMDAFFASRLRREAPASGDSE